MKPKYDPHLAHPDTVLGLLEWVLTGATGSEVHRLTQALRAQCAAPEPDTQVAKTVPGGAEARSPDEPAPAPAEASEESVPAREGRPCPKCGVPMGRYSATMHAGYTCSRCGLDEPDPPTEDPLPCPGCGRPMARVGGPGARRGWTCVNCNAAGDPDEDHPDADRCSCEEALALRSKLDSQGRMLEECANTLAIAGYGDLAWRAHAMRKMTRP